MALGSLVLAAPASANSPPTAVIEGGNASGEAPLKFTIDGSGSTDADGKIVSWDWDFGDSVTATGQTASHWYIYPGTYTITLTTTDDAGATDTARVIYQVGGDAPQPPKAVIAGGDVSGPVPLKFAVDGSGSTDRDGEIVSWEWNFGDGVTATGPTAQHWYIYPGTYTIALTVTDDSGLTSTSEVVYHAGEEPTAPDEERRMLMVVANLASDRPDELMPVIRRAKAKGANTLFFSDTKIDQWGMGRDVGPDWEPRMRELYRKVVEEEGMDFVFNTILLGYCGGILSTDVNLATGTPIEKQPMKMRGGELRPVSTASIANGGFERSAGNRVLEWTGLQDGVGTRTFIDRNIARSGEASLRMDLVEGESTRISTQFAVEPFHQYTLNFWVRTENLNANNIEVLVRDAQNPARRLTTQRLSDPFNPARPEVRKYFQRASDKTTGWTEMKLSFNSMDTTNVEMFFAMFGGGTGSIWWDDLRVVDTPTLNWIDRDDLDVEVEGPDGATLTEGADYLRIIDPGLGTSAYAGNYDSYHPAPRPVVPASSRLREGDKVLVSGYHTTIAYTGQVGCSWNAPDVFTRVRQIHDRLEREFDPHGYMINYDEIRSGGWEPRDFDIGTAGEALATSLESSMKEVRAVTDGATYYLWSDMFDPTHNAKADFGQVRGSLDGAWEQLDPEEFILATWWEQPDVAKKGRESLEFFADLGFRQVIGGFYDANVADNHADWAAAAAGVPGIIGSMYASWAKDYSKIEDFGDLWWNGESAIP